MKKPDSKQLLVELLDTYNDLLVPFMKIERDMPFAGNADRNETDAEHIFTLAMIALTINHRLQFGLDSGKLALYALIHDLVEAYAGDISVRAGEAELAQKAENERVAFEQISARYAQTAPWIAPLIHNYENRVDDEAKFIYAVDKHMGGLTRLAADGERIEEYYPHTDGSHYKLVVERLRQKVTLYPELLEFFDELHEQLDVVRAQRVAQAQKNHQ